jgi:hypothetical protein
MWGSLSIAALLIIVLILSLLPDRTESADRAGDREMKWYGDFHNRKSKN